MHKLLDVSSFIFEEMTDDFSDKQIGNEFWKFTKTKFLDDNTKKIKVVDFVYDYILKLDEKYYMEKYGVSLKNIKKSKAEVTFVSEIISKMIKHSNIPLIDY